MAVSGVLKESSTFASTSFIDNLFSDLPADSRFTQVVTQKIVPISALDSCSDKIEFLLPALQNPNVYFLNKTLIECSVVMQKKDGTMPDKTKILAPVNMCLTSLFESVSVRLNDVSITASGRYYPYKCYLQTLLSFNQAQKNSFLQQMGWYQDSPSSEVTPSSSNTGFLLRSANFRKGRELNTEYRFVQQVSQFNFFRLGCFTCLMIFKEKIKIGSFIDVDRMEPRSLANCTMICPPLKNVCPQVSRSSLSWKGPLTDFT